MSERVPARVRWAVETLDVAPADRILEIGGGPGLAASLICEQLQSGHLLLIDRSATAIERTRRRNLDHVASGRLALETVDIADFAPAGRLFDKVFAVNVNVFWTSPAEVELARVRRSLDRDGKLFLLYETPTCARADEAARRVAEAVQANGFLEPTIVRANGNLVGCISTSSSSGQADAPE